MNTKKKSKVTTKKKSKAKTKKKPRVIKVKVKELTISDFSTKALVDELRNRVAMEIITKKDDMQEIEFKIDELESFDHKIANFLEY